MIRILSARVPLVGNQPMAPDWFSFLADWVRDYNKKQYTVNAERQEVTGVSDAVEVAEATVTIGNGGSIRLTINTSCTNNANDKSMIIRANGVDIQTVSIDGSTDSQSFTMQIIGRGAGNQYMAVTNQINCAGVSGALTLDGFAAITMTVALQLSTITDTIALESWALYVEST